MMKAIEGSHINKTKILMVDDHPIVREGMAQFLNQQPGLVLCCEANNTEEALTAMRRCPHELAIVDISLGNDSGLELIKILRRHYPALAILSLSMHDETLFADRALKAGANGYLMKQEATKNILLAVQQVLSGRIYLSSSMRGSSSHKQAAGNPLEALSEREFEVLHLIGLGYGTRQIAEKLNRSIKTVEAHRANLRVKLNLDTGRALMRFAVQHLENP